MTDAERTRLEQRMIMMEDREVVELYTAQEGQSEEADIIAEFAKVRGNDL